VQVRPVVGAREYVFGEVEGHDELIGWVLLELLSVVAASLKKKQQRRAWHSDDGRSVLANEGDRGHATSSPRRGRL